MLDGMTDFEAMLVTLLLSGLTLVAGLAVLTLRSKWCASGAGGTPAAQPHQPAPPQCDEGTQQQAVRLLGGPGELPVVRVKPLDPLASLRATDKLAHKQGGAHLVTADRAYTEPEVAWALTQWLYQERIEQRKRRHRW